MHRALVRTIVFVTAVALAAPASAQQWERDEWLDRPVDDATFASFLDFFAYDPDLPFNTQVTASRTADGVRIEDLVFESTAGVRVTATLFSPAAAEGTLPAVLAIHGGGTTGRRSWDLTMGPAMASSGRLFLAIDLLYWGERSTGLLQTYQNPEKAERLYNQPSLFVEWITQTVKDIGRSYDFLVQERNADPDRVTLLGFSRGGQIALIGGGADSRFANVIAVASGHFDALETGHRAPACPANYIGRIGPRPLLTINGEHDNDYDPKLSVAPLHALTGPWHEARWLDSGHVIDFREALVLIMDWLQRVAPIE